MVEAEAGKEEVYLGRRRLADRFVLRGLWLLRLLKRRLCECGGEKLLELEIARMCQYSILFASWSGTAKDTLGLGLGR